MSIVKKLKCEKKENKPNPADAQPRIAEDK